MTPEGRVKEKVKQIFAEMGVMYFMPVGSMYGRGGVADFIACLRGYFVAVETKATDKAKPTKLQAKFISDVRMARGIVLVIHPGNYDELRQVLKTIQLSGELM